MAALAAQICGGSVPQTHLYFRFFSAAVFRRRGAPPSAARKTAIVGEKAWGRCQASGAARTVTTPICRCTSHHTLAKGIEFHNVWSVESAEGTRASVPQRHFITRRRAPPVRASTLLEIGRAHV